MLNTLIISGVLHSKPRTADHSKYFQDIEIGHMLPKRIKWRTLRGQVCAVHNANHIITDGTQYTHAQQKQKG